ELMQSTEQEQNMRKNLSFIKGLVACGLSLAMLMTLSAQSMMQGKAKVVRIHGNARYSTGNNVWQPLRVGAKLKPGALIQTAANSYVDLVLGDGEAPVATTSVISQAMFYQPNAEQNLVRVF